MEKISEAEYRKLKSVAPLKTERKTKYGNREVTYQEAYQFADLPFDTIQWFNTSASVRSLLERLPIGDVLRPQKSGIKPDLGTPMHFSEFMNNELCDEVARCAIKTVPSCSRTFTLLQICFITTMTSATIGMCKSLPVTMQRILSNRIGSRQRNGKKKSCSFTASIVLSVLHRMVCLYLMMSAIFMGMPHS